MEPKIKGLKLDHIAYAVKSTDQSIKAFSCLYPLIKTYKCLEQSQNVLITYLSNLEETFKIELVEPMGEENPVKNILSSRTSALYHICYKVENFKTALQQMKESGYFMITRPFETTVEKGVWACHFFHPLSGIIEIIGVPKNE